MVELPNTQGTMGFDDKPDRKKKENLDIITKEETMFKIDGDGKAIPEKCPIYIYNRNLDMELMKESLLLMAALRKKEAIAKVTANIVQEQTIKLSELQDKIDKEQDVEKKRKLEIEYGNVKTIYAKAEIDTQINTEIVEAGINESRELMKKIKDQIALEKVTQFAEIVPCTTAEAYLAFEKNKTIDNKDTLFWVEDLISRKVMNPKYTFEEAKLLRLDYKTAFKEAIMAASDYQVEGYRDMMIRVKLEQEKPLTLKKEETTSG